MENEAASPINQVRESLKDARGYKARVRAFRIIRPRVDGFLKQFPDSPARLRRMKLEALAENADLVQLAISRMEQNGMKVFYARTGSEAVAYACSVFGVPGVVVKSKSNMGKELHLPEALSIQGHQVIETDLGDRINQLGGWHGSHVLAPAASVDRGQVRELLQRELGEPLTDDVNQLVAAARRSLRAYFERADYGLSGANAIAAETGTVCLMENEGNIRAVTSMPRVHVVMAGIHKVVPTIKDAVQVIRGASLFGAGQLFGNYLSCISGPNDGIGGPTEVHVVLVDDGRSAALAGPYREAFACINCGSCLNYCPVYGEIGDAYGGRRTGGIGNLQTALLDGNSAAEADGAGLCIGCGKCRTVCPVQLDTPGLLARLKAEAGLTPPSAATRLLLGAISNRKRLRRTGRLVRFYQRSGLQKLVRASGILKPLGLAPAESLLPPPVTPAPLPGHSRAKGVRQGSLFFFRGCLMDELMQNINRDTLTVLFENRCQVLTPPAQGCCGAMHAHSGDLEAARQMARQNIDAFEGVGPIITNSGGCGAQLKAYGELLKDDPAYAKRAVAFAARVRDLSEYLVEVGMAPMAGVEPVRVTYQDSCHLAVVQGITEQPRTLLRQIPGVELVEMDSFTACCGSGGTWSIEQPELAERLRQVKLEEAKATGAEMIVTANPGCLLHLAGHGRKVVHLAELLARAYQPTERATPDQTKQVAERTAPDQTMEATK